MVKYTGDTLVVDRSTGKLVPKDNYVLPVKPLEAERLLAWRQYAQAQTGAEKIDALVELERVGELGYLAKTGAELFDNLMKIEQEGDIRFCDQSK